MPLRGGMLNNPAHVVPVQVCTEGRLILEFAFDDLMRIKTWHFTIRQYRELIPRSILAMHVSVTPFTCSSHQLKELIKCLKKGVTFWMLTRFSDAFLEAIHKYLNFKCQQSSLGGFFFFFCKPVYLQTSKATKDKKGPLSKNRGKNKVEWIISLIPLSVTHI